MSEEDAIKYKIKSDYDILRSTIPNFDILPDDANYRDWETDRKSTRLNSSHSRASRMPSSA